MKYLFLSGAMLLLVFAVKGQIVSDKMNIVYRGLSNPMSFGAFGYACKDVVVQVDTGEITFHDEAENCGSFIYSAPLSGTKATFRLFAQTKKGVKPLWTAIFRIKDIPDPEAYVGSRRNDEIAIPKLRAQQGMLAKLNGMDICANYRVDSFNYAIIRNEKVLFTGKNKSPVFDKNIKMYFSSLEHNDTVLFYNIYCHGATRIATKLEAFELKAVK